jgi:hypothetical protein
MRVYMKFVTITETGAEGIRIQGVEENIWTEER